MVREFSAGGVVLRRRNGKWWIAVIEPAGRRSASATDDEPGILALPKGLVDKGEKPEETALREVFEETGVRATPIAKLRDIKYFYVRTWGDRARVFKVVSFYLLRYQSGKLGDIAEEMRIEVRQALWLPLEDAPLRLAYRGEKEVARAAQQYVQAHEDL